MEVASADSLYVEKNPSRHGKMRYFLRYKGKRFGRLPDDAEGEEFTSEYWRLRNRAENSGAPHPTDNFTILPNTFRWLCVTYKQTDAFTSLAIETQTKRTQIMDAMCLEPIKPDSDKIFAFKPLSTFSSSDIQVLRDRKKATPFAADERLKILRQVFATEQNDKPITDNVALLVKSFRKKSDGHHTMNESEVLQYLNYYEIGSKPWIIGLIMFFTGLRVSDLATLGPQHRHNNEFNKRVFKGRDKKPITVKCRVHPLLASALDAYPTNHACYIMTEFGKPYSIKGLGQYISKLFDRAGLPHCSAHTARKGLATHLAENEATNKMLDGLFGWRDGKTSKIYTEKADRGRLANQAIDRINWGQIENELPHPENTWDSSSTIKKIK